MRLLLICLPCLLLLSCRDVTPYEPPAVATGYMLRGKVTTKNGIPLDSVSVLLYYQYALVSRTPLDTVPFVVTEPARLIDISAFDAKKRFLRQIFFGYRPVGTVIRVRWDEFDDSNNVVPSAKYYLRYIYDNKIIKIVPYLADGNPTARTDTNGEFLIGNDNLPVGEIFDLYKANGEYDATYRVTPNVGIVLTRNNVLTPYSLTLKKNSISRAFLTLE